MAYYQQGSPILVACYSFSCHEDYTLDRLMPGFTREAPSNLIVILLSLRRSKSKTQSALAPGLR